VSKSAISHVRPEDSIVFYVKGTMMFKGIFRVDSEWYPALAPLWYEEMAEGKIIYKSQCRASPIALGDVPYKSLVPSLTFVVNKREYQVYIQGTRKGPGNFGRPIPQADFDLILREMEKAAVEVGPPAPVFETGSPPHATDVTVSTPAMVLARKRRDYFLPSLLLDLQGIARGRVDLTVFREDRSPPALFEDLVFLSFKFLGFDLAVQLGYRRSGRKQAGPDGELTGRGVDYTAVYDAKLRASGYVITTEDHRALRDYIEKERDRTAANLCCLLISSEFSERPRPIDGVPLSYLPVDSLLELLAFKIQNPYRVNPKTLKRLLMLGTLIGTSEIEAWAADLDLEQVDIGHILRRERYDVVGQNRGTGEASTGRKP